MMAGDKGLLAMDESDPTCNKRFAEAGIPQTEAARQAYRDLIIATPGLGGCINGVILYYGTIRQRTADGRPFVEAVTGAGIMPGIKVDLGAKDLAGHPGEKVTEGLDGLRPRLQEYAGMGARFAKWRAVIALGDGLPSRGCIDANAHALARYAALYQEAGLVPIVEPEVLLEGVPLKPGMVLPDLNCPEQASVDEVADATVISVLRVVPAAVPRIVLLSGSRSSTLATAQSDAMTVRFRPPEARLPWALAFSFAQPIQHPAIVIWQGQEGSRMQAQQALHDRAKLNHAACHGKCDSSMEAA